MAAATVGAVSGALACALVSPAGASAVGASQEVTRTAQEVMLRGNVVGLLLHLMQPAQQQQQGGARVSLPAAEAAPPLSLMWRLLSAGMPFVQQFLQASRKPGLQLRPPVSPPPGYWYPAFFPFPSSSTAACPRRSWRRCCTRPTPRRSSRRPC